MRFQRLTGHFRRQLQESQQQVEGLGVRTEKHLERHVFKRFGRLAPVKRFIFGWVALVLLLIVSVLIQNFLLSRQFQTLQPVPGGIYREGVLGTFTNANPLYATTSADTTVSRLVFSGLLTYDKNNKLVGDLAESYDVDAKGSTYTLKLRPNLTWHDGKPLTSADVLFTYQLIQNPDTQSPLQTSWQGITVTAPDPQTVVFKLPSSLASFPYNLTNGIVPKHILDKISPVDLRSSEFNTMNPVGAGPYAWQAIEVIGRDPGRSQEQIALKPFENYHHGKPKLDEFIVNAFASEESLVDALRSGRVTAAAGLSVVPKDIADDEAMVTQPLVLNAATMVFFKTSTGILADKQIRLALVRATDAPVIIDALGYPTKPVKGPLLVNQLGYDPTLAQPPHNLEEAGKLLDAAGWKLGPDGIRTKDGQKLTFTLSASDNPEYIKVTKLLQKQWKEVGVKLDVQYQDPGNFQNTLSTHGYDAVLYGISIGTDPDVFVYWHSSQGDVRSSNRLNLSEYKNNQADLALEAGRNRQDAATRIVKYKPFLQAFQQDAPAVGLYQPRFTYVTRGQVYGLDNMSPNSAVNRFDNVHNWQVRQDYVTNED